MVLISGSCQHGKHGIDCIECYRLALADAQDSCQRLTDAANEKDAKLSAALLQKSAYKAALQEIVNNSQKCYVDCAGIAEAALSDNRVASSPNVCDSCGWNNDVDHGGGSRVMYTVGKVTKCGECLPTRR